MKTINLQAEIEKEKKKFSFVVPVYRTEKYLKRCLKSLLNQSYKNIEIIVVADGRSRRASRIFGGLKSKDKRLIKYVTIKHGGAPKARNSGYPYTTGNYVSFWDSDCYAAIGMVKMWAKAFLVDPKAGFVYSGYRFENEDQNYLESEPFHKYLLTCYNYIATMFPMKREIFPGFDENLKSLQDWDLWLTLAQKGYRGYFLEGSGFSTEPPRKGSISAGGCTPDKWLERYEAVRKKHGINHREIAFTSMAHKLRGVQLARTFKQDYFDTTQYHHPHRYKMIYCIGFYSGDMHIASMAFKTADPDCKRILHWMGYDIETIFMQPYKLVKALAGVLKTTINKHYCENEQSRKMLEELGLKAEILPLPMEYEKIKMPRKEFKIFYENDNHTRDTIKQIVSACPDIKFENYDICDLAEYSCFLSLTGSIMPSENFKKFIAAGRYVITNYQMLHSGNVGLDKEEITREIRKCKRLWKRGIINKEGQKYYKKLIDPREFKRKVIRECQKSLS